MDACDSLPGNTRTSLAGSLNPSHQVLQFSSRFPHRTLPVRRCFHRCFSFLILGLLVRLALVGMSLFCCCCQRPLSPPCFGWNTPFCMLGSMCHAMPSPRPRSCWHVPHFLHGFSAPSVREVTSRMIASHTEALRRHCESCYSEHALGEIRKIRKS